MIILKSEEEIKLMRESGHITALVLQEIAKNVREGISTGEMDRIAEDMIVKLGGKPAFKGYRGYRHATCISINEEVVHGIPGKRKLKKGDVVSVDMGVFLKDYCSDSAFTYAIGDIGESNKKLLEVTKEALYKGIAKALSGNRLGDLSSEIQTYVEKHGLSVVRDLVGHGIGREMHEEPQVPNYGEPGLGPLLKTGMVLAIEPMVNRGTWKIFIKDDKWTVVTADARCSAHFEHTVAVTEEGPRILTLPIDADRKEEYPFS
jgi:methionyl aminopeptidase